MKLIAAALFCALILAAPTAWATDLTPGPAPAGTAIAQYNHQTGDIIVSERTSHHNAGNWTEEGMVYRKVRGPLKGQMIPFEYRPDRRLFAIAKRAMQDFSQKPIEVQGRSYVPEVRVGRVASGDVFGVTRQKIKDIRAKLGSDLIEMESAAAAQVCWQLGVPHLVIRSGSNLAQPDPGGDYRALGQIAAHQAARFAVHFVKKLGKPASAGSGTGES